VSSFVSEYSSVILDIKYSLVAKTAKDGMRFRHSVQTHTLFDDVTARDKIKMATPMVNPNKLLNDV